jgi:glycosyltransferase involved in cell wall biosynthesis
MKILILGEWPTGAASYLGGPRRFNQELCRALEGQAGWILANPRRATAGHSRLRQAEACLAGAVSFRPDVVHVTTDGFHVLLALASKLAFGSKIAYSVHSLLGAWPALRNAIPWHDRLRRQVVEWAMRRFADCAVFPSAYYRDACLRAGYRFRSDAVVYHGAPPPAGGERPPRPVFSIFGPCLDVKGFDRLTAMCDELAGLGSVRWIGFNPDDAAERSAAARWHGPAGLRRAVPAAQVEAELRQTTVTLVPSRQESFGIIALEAASVGVPVVVSVTTGAAELVRRHGGGRVVDFDTPGELRNAVREILAAYPEFAERARACARAHSWQATAAGYADVYRRLAERPVAAHRSQHQSAGGVS